MRQGKAVLFMFFTVSIQYLYSQDVMFDIHGSYSNAQLTNQTIYNTSLNAWDIGIGGAYNFGKHTSIVFEINYELKGAAGTISYYNTSGDKLLSYDKDLQLHYITLPAMLRYSIGSQKMHAFANVGFYYGFLAGAWVNPQTKGVSHDVTADFNRNDLGFAAGAGLLYQLTPSYGLSLEWRNNTGLLSVSPTVNNQFNRSNSFQLGVQYTFLQKEDPTTD